MSYFMCVYVYAFDLPALKYTHIDVLLHIVRTITSNSKCCRDDIVNFYHKKKNRTRTANRSLSVVSYRYSSSVSLGKKYWHHKFSEQQQQHRMQIHEQFKYVHAFCLVLFVFIFDLFALGKHCRKATSTS